MTFAVEKLSPDNACAVLVDYLTGFLPGLRSIDRDDYDRAVRGFCGTVKAFDLPVAVLGDEGSFRGDFFPVIGELFADAPTFARTTSSGWGAQGFPEWLAGTRRMKVLIGGISLDNCTMMTVLDLLANGYEPYVVIDASGTESDLVERVALARLVQAGAVPVNWVQAAAELLGDWAGPHGEAVGRLFRDHSKWNALGTPGA
jgi:hypothetical protein